MGMNKIWEYIAYAIIGTATLAGFWFFWIITGD